MPNLPAVPSGVRERDNLRAPGPGHRLRKTMAVHAPLLLREAPQPAAHLADVIHRHGEQDPSAGDIASARCVWQGLAEGDNKRAAVEAQRRERTVLGGGEARRPEDALVEALRALEVLHLEGYG